MPLNVFSPNVALQRNPIYRFWQHRARQARQYLNNIRPAFVVRDDNAQFSFLLRHGLLDAPVPPSHKVIVPDTATSTKRYNEILNRLVALLTAVYPQWILRAAGLSPRAGLAAAKVATFLRSLWLAIEDLAGVPVIRQFMDNQLGVGSAFFRVHWRMDRWRDLPIRDPGEDTADYDARVMEFKASNPPFDIVVPEVDRIYYDQTVDGLSRVIENRRISVHEAAAAFGGHYSAESHRLSIPVTLPAFDRYGDAVLDAEGNHIEEVRHLDMVLTDNIELEYTEFWDKSADPGVVYMLNDVPVRFEQMEPEEEIPYFLGLGEVTSSPDPGRMGLPIMYNAFESFMRRAGLMAMEYSFLWKHGYARMVKKAHQDKSPATEEPDMPDQEEEEETIGELTELDYDEDLHYITPANVSALFADAKRDTDDEIEKTALADVLTGKMPPSGTTGFLMSQLVSGAVSKYIPVLHQTARAIRMASLYMLKQIDREMQSEVVVPVQQDERSEKPFVSYEPKSRKGNSNLEVRIDAPLPSDKIAITQWLSLGHQGGYVSRERVQREGYRVEQPELEDEKINLETFQEFYRPIGMLKAMQRAGQMNQVLEAARAGILPPQLANLALQFAAGPDGLQPTQNPNQIIQPQPGLGEPAVPTAGGAANAGFGLPGRAAGAERRPGNQPGEPIIEAPVSPV